MAVHIDTGSHKKTSRVKVFRKLKLPLKPKRKDKPDLTLDKKQR